VFNKSIVRIRQVPEDSDACDKVKGVRPKREVKTVCADYPRSR